MADKPRELTRLRTRPMERNWAMTRMGMGTGMRAAGHVLGNMFRDAESRSERDDAFVVAEAQRLVTALGELKGSVMKAGQMLSLYGQYFMPPEAVEILASLQDDTDHVGWGVVGPVVDQALGPERLAELEIARVPIGAASLGQAHAVTQRKTGTKLCMKVRYPGVDEAIDSDIRTIARLLTLSRLVPKDLSLDPVFTEVREMLHREVDYANELQLLQRFYSLLADDARYIVPRPFPEYSSSEVLTMSFEDGLSLKSAEVAALTSERRNRLGQALLELFLNEFFVWNLVQTDPHFGNYRLRLDPEGQDDRWVLLDFGATRGFPSRFVTDYARIVRGALNEDRDEVVRGAVGIGLMRETFPDNVLDGFFELTRLIVEPFVDDEYDWGDSDLPARVSQTVARNTLTRHFKIPPREIVFLHRRLAGVFITLAWLKVRLNARPMLESALAHVEAQG
ncbi:MAG: AarF/ABC1/UbiB kinase family protein [Oceanococcaceae bacterium]